MSTSAPDVRLHAYFQDIRPRLDGLPTEALARKSGFLKRKPRKIPIPDLTAALAALGAETHLTLERVVAAIRLAADETYTKQAFHERLTPAIAEFLTLVAAALLPSAAGAAGQPGWARHFPRVLLQDSTCLPLPDALAKAFPGSRNQRRRQGGTLKLQFITDLVGAAVVDWSLSGFTRNDQAAAVDILDLVRPGDLVLRDLGYCVLKGFRRLDERGAFFLSRARLDLNFYDPATGQKLDLYRHLKTQPHWDGWVLAGEDKVRLRLVAEPVAEDVANERRRKARGNRDRRLNPSPERLFLLGWNLFLTNVPATVWPPKALFWVYRLRWRIEIVFKAWKSHLRFTELNVRNELLVRLSVLTKLLFCLLVVKGADTLESCSGPARQVSLLRFARVMGHCACLFAAAVLRVTPADWLAHQVRHLIDYEPRTDRKNFYELIKFVDAGLT